MHVDFGNNSEPKRALLRAARDMVDARARRRELFPQTLFGEPAWDILLHLYAGPPSADIAALSVAAGAPVTTIERWMTFLQAQGYVRPSDDRSPETAVFRLAEKAIRALDIYLAEILERSEASLRA